MRDQFESQLQQLLEQILLMGELAESMVDSAVHHLLDRDEARAADVFDREDRLDEMEVAVDDRVVGLVIQQQPVARDARFATAAVRISTDLERIGDQAVAIVKSVRHLADFAPSEPPAPLRQMADLAKRMVAESLIALAARDAALAERVLGDERQANGLRDAAFRALLNCMITDPLTAQRSLSLVLISRNLERIADHATNIAEEVLYLVRGQDVRHRPGRHAIVSPLPSAV